MKPKLLMLSSPSGSFGLRDIKEAYEKSLLVKPEIHVVHVDYPSKIIIKHIKNERPN